MVKSFPIKSNKTSNGAYIIGENSIIADNVEFDGYCIIGENCRLGNNVRIINSILWDNINIEDNVTIKDSIILTGTKIEKNINHQIVSENQLKEHTIIRV